MEEEESAAGEGGGGGGDRGEAAEDVGEELVGEDVHERRRQVFRRGESEIGNFINSANNLN